MGSFGEVFEKRLRLFHLTQTPWPMSFGSFGASTHGILPAQIAIGFDLENRDIASVGRQARAKAHKMSSACVLSKSIVGDTTSLCSRVASCLVHNASRRDSDGLSPCPVIERGPSLDSIGNVSGVGL